MSYASLVTVDAANNVGIDDRAEDGIRSALRSHTRKRMVWNGVDREDAEEILRQLVG